MPSLDLVSGGFSPDAVSEVRRRLDEVRATGVRILFAIESGSRAWGFPSPDSDYDCRFVYVRPIDDHLKLNPDRDVIEFPVLGDMDINGWDLRKALLLALKGNAAIVEWVDSPHVYEEMPGFRRRLSALLERIVEPRLVARHYLGLLRRHDHIFTDDTMKLKKLFYALRPALSLHYMEERGFAVLPPMNMPETLENVRLPSELSGLIAGMIEEKRLTREMGTGKPPERISRFLADARDRYGAILDKLGPVTSVSDSDLLAAAERFYIDEVRGNEAV